MFTKLHAGGKFGGGSYNASGGLHGVGASVVNALSSRLDVQVDRGSKTYQMSFRHGIPGFFESCTPKPEDPFTPATEGTDALQIVGRAKRGVTGTRVRYWADPQIFTPDAKFSYEDLAARARQTAFLIPGLRICIRDERRLPGTPGELEPHEEVFQYDGGISEFVEFLAHDERITDTWRFSGSGSFTETVPVLGEDGTLAADRRGARLRSGRCAALGHWLRDDGPQLREYYCHPQGRYSHDRFRAGLVARDAQAPCR